jgi:hypothetical protein
VDRLAKHHGITEDTATDYLLAAALLTAADRYGLELRHLPQVVRNMVDVLQGDELPEAVRH